MNTHEMVRQFHEVYEVPVGAAPNELDDARLELRLRLIRDEVSELEDASRARDMIEMLDALGDIVYVCHGMAIEMGVDLNAVIAEIHRANLSKLGADGRPIINDGVIKPALPIGKVLKGPNFSPPNIRGVIFGPVSA
jgi:predicted HAD superfamily Cof-like phosphohydrolase